MVEKELKEKKNYTYPEDPSNNDKLFPHEFLFLLCNARNRLELINKLPKPEFTTERRNIKKYEMQ